MNLYLISDEYESLKGSFECFIIANIKASNRQALIVNIKPLNLECRTPSDTLLLIGKYGDKRISKMDKYPIDVVAFIPDNIDQPAVITRKWSEMNSIAWAKLDNKL